MCKGCNLIERFTEKTVYYFLLGILVVSVLCFFPCVVIHIMRYPDLFSVTEFVWLVPAVLLVWLTYVLGAGVSVHTKYISPISLAFICSNVLFLSFLLTFDSIPTTDWKHVWSAANQMAQGTYTDGVKNGSYMHEIPYQLGFAYFQSLIIRCFGANYAVIRFFNLIMMNAMLWIVYHFSKRKTNEHVAGYAIMASGLFLSWSMTIGVMTNHVIGFLLLYLSLYLYEKDKLWTCVLSGIALACLHFVRPMAAVVLAAIFCYAIYRWIKGDKLTRVVSNIVGFYLGFLAVCFLLDTLLLSLGYTDIYVSQSKRNIYHKITYTTYESKVDGTIADYNYDYEAYDAAYKAELFDMLTNHSDEIALGIANKMCRYLGLLDYGFEMTYNHDEAIWKKYPIKAIYSIQWFQYIIYLLIGILGYLKYRKTHETDLYQIFFIGNTLIYIFIEAFTSYRFENYLYLLFLVGYGMSEMGDKSKMAKRALSCEDSTVALESDCGV